VGCAYGYGNREEYRTVYQTVWAKYIRE